MEQRETQVKIRMIIAVLFMTAVVGMCWFAAAPPLSWIYLLKLFLLWVGGILMAWGITLWKHRHGQIR